MEEDDIASPAHDKAENIQRACETHSVERLREFARSEGGLLDDELRRRAWPILLACDTGNANSTIASKELPEHRDEGQVQLDVDRSFVYYPEAETESKKDSRKQELSQVITTVLRRHPMLHYFQGYHDIVQVLLLVLGVDAATTAAARLSLLRIRDFMLPTMAGTEPHLRLLPAILYAADPTLATHLSQTQPFFALPATLTLYAHEIEEYGSISRLFDYLLASEAVVSVYLFAAVIRSRKSSLLDIEADEPEMLHSVLSKLPRPLNLEALINDTVFLFEKYPPERLPGRAWARISSNSVLKTTRKFDEVAQQTLQDGERFFAKEAAELQRQAVMQQRLQQYRALARRYRRPAAFTSIAMIVAIAAMLLRSHSLPDTLTGSSTIFLGLQRRIVEFWQRMLE